AGAPLADGGTRPVAGIVKLDTVPDVLEALRQTGGLDRKDDSPPLFLAIDFGQHASLGAEEQPWVQFLTEAVKQPWLRLLVVGLHDVPGHSFIASVTNRGLDVDIQEEKLAHVDLRELVDCAKAMLSDSGMTDRLPTIRASITRQWNTEPRLFNTIPEMKTV